MRPNYLKACILETHVLSSRLMDHVQYMTECLSHPWPFQFQPTQGIFHQMLVEHAKDIVEISTVNYIRNSPANNLDTFCRRLVSSDDRGSIALLKRFYTEVAGMEWHERIIALVGTQTYDIWQVESSIDVITLRYVGDYRIMEWERDHIVNGEYHADPITAQSTRR